MVKSINIGGNDYVMKSSAFTPFKYKNDYGKDLLKDVGLLNKKNREINKLKKDEQEDAWLSEFTEIVEMGLRMAYTMITEYDKTFKPYDEWLGEIDSLFDNTDWLMEVMELAMSTFQRKLQGK